MTRRLVILITSPRVAPGLLSAPAWSALRGADVSVLNASGAADWLRAAGLEVHELDPRDSPPELAQQLLSASADAVLVTSGPPPHSLVAEVVRGAADAGVELETVHGSYDLPGARLLDVVAVMDRLRSPGGCPWDADQTHLSLAKHLVEEAYEAVEAIETADLDALREELGDVLLQVAFHSRLAEEHAGWSVDDVAADLVDKLVRRHPHVFGDGPATTAGDVQAAWDEIKAAEKPTGSGPFDSVPQGQPALALAAALQRKAARAGIDVGADEVVAALAAAHAAPGEDAIGELLYAVVSLAVEQGIDPEGALRARARRLRDAAVAS